MKDTLKKLICLIVKKPQEVLVEENNNIFNVKTHPQDIKFVIGKKGRTIKALQELLRIRGGKVNPQKIEIKIHQE